MPHNKNALIRYKTIDKCLQNHYRTWTLNDLIEACSDALYEFEGKHTNVSKRTVQMDIQMMRSEKLGYNAPIEVYEKKYYRYADEDFTITDIPLNENDMHVLTETVEMLKQFKDFSLFSELGSIVQRLEDKIYVEKNKRPSIIHLDRNENLVGLQHLEPIYQAILKKLVLQIQYQSFKAEKPKTLTFHPMLLKEFNNRWFVVGKYNEKSRIVTLALDRIASLEYDLDVDYIDVEFDGDTYFQHTIGVTVLGENHVSKVVVKIDKSNAPYVLTKPFHHSQKVVREFEDGSVIVKIYVNINYELERLLLGFGDSLEVLFPNGLRRRIKSKLKLALEQYEKKSRDDWWEI